MNTTSTTVDLVSSLRTEAERNLYTEIVLSPYLLQLSADSSFHDNTLPVLTRSAAHGVRRQSGGTPSETEATSEVDGLPALPPGEPDQSTDFGFGLFVLAHFLAAVAVWVGYQQPEVGLPVASSIHVALALGATAAIVFYLASGG